MLVLIEDDDEPSDDKPTGINDYWHMLVVDDAPEVLEVTSMALKGLKFFGKELQIHAADSARQAKQILLGDIPFAIAIVDVVMETDHAGLDLIRWIRDEQKNHRIRLVIRTGQPGQAPERDVISTLDINDYKAKTELTADKLYTLIYACLRSYRDIVALHRNKLGLEAIIQSSNKIFAHQSLADFTQGALIQLCALLHIDTGALYTNVDCIAASHGDKYSKVLAATGRFKEFLNEPLDKVLAARDETKFQELYRAGGQKFGDDFFIGVYKSRLGFDNLLFLDGIKIDSELDKQLVEIFSANIGIAFDNQAIFEETETTQRQMIYHLAEARENGSKQPGKHVQLVALICQTPAQAMDMEPREIEVLYRAVPLHDIGKVAIPDHILNKPRKLEPDEWEIMQSHAQIGFDMLNHSQLDVLKVAAIIAAQHHENWDGSGYPKGKKGLDIHIYGRIAAVADVFDVLYNKRCYKDPWPVEDIMSFFKKMSGVKFEPSLVDLVVKKQDELISIQQTYPD